MDHIEADSVGFELVRQLELAVDHLTAHMEQKALSGSNWTRGQWWKNRIGWQSTAKKLRHQQRRIEYIIRHCTLGVVVARRHPK